MKSWQTLSSEVLLKNAWITIHKDSVMTPNGQPGEYTFITNKPFVLIVAIAPEGWLLVSQYRYTLKQTMLEFPAGSIEGEETALEAARRELKEETGHEAQSWVEIGIINEATSTNNAVGKVFLAQELTNTPHNQMAEEGIENLHFMSEKTIAAKIAAGAITDTKTIATYYMAIRHLNNIN